jgi:hypothetical protein
MRLLFITTTVMSCFLAITMLFFQIKQERYSGLGHWTAGAAAIALGHLALALRGIAPDFPSIFIGNVAYPVGTVLFLDGMRRFLSLPPMSRMWYAFPALDGAACLYFYFVYDSPTARGLATAVALTVPHFATALLVFRHMAKEKLLFYPVIAIEMIVAGALVLLRAFWTLTLPHFALLMESPVQHAFFILIMVSEIIVTLSFIMLNAERLEKELRAADQDSKAKVEQLKRAMSEVKTLSGLLPICASCKKIRDDNGSWHHIEEYIRDRSEADFSHGICPECTEKLYPDYWKRKKEGP